MGTLSSVVVINNALYRVAIILVLEFEAVPRITWFSRFTWRRHPRRWVIVVMEVLAFDSLVSINDGAQILLTEIASLVKGLAFREVPFLVVALVVRELLRSG